MKEPETRPSAWKALGIAVAVIALVGGTLLTIAAVWFVLALRSFGSNK